jgi:hypothetical protein
MLLAVALWQFDRAPRASAPHLTTNQQVRLFQENLGFGTRDAFSMSMRRLPWLEYKRRTSDQVSGHNLPGDTRVLFEIAAWIPSDKNVDNDHGRGIWLMSA